jgi:hypothetical protein
MGVFKKPSYLENLKKRREVRENFTSKYWLEDDYDVYTDRSSGTDILKLANNRRAISNFVNIVTGDPTIKVTYNTGGNSYTDGKTVTIGNSIKSANDFDVSVGLALHEASHILLTDFSTLEKIQRYNVVSNLPKSVIDKMNEALNKDSGAGLNIMDHPECISAVSTKVRDLVKNLVNYIEDRRIDSYIYKTAPGYRGYYDSLYVKYFYNKVVDKGLKSHSYRSETIDSYLFRIINLHNPNSDLTALSGLAEVSSMIDLPNIGRFTNTNQVLELSYKIANVILDKLNWKFDPNSQNIFETEASDGSSGGNSGDSSDEDSETPNDSKNKSGSGNEAGNGEGNESGTGDGEDGEDKETGSQPNNTNETESNSNPAESLNPKETDQLEKAIQQMKDFINGNLKKTKVSNKTNQMVSSMESSGVSMVEVGNGYDDRSRIGKTSCIVVKNFTEALFNLGSQYFPLTGTWGTQHKLDIINAGFTAGTVLGKKLLTRAEERNTVYTRQKTGKIDKRLVSGLGFGAENVFHQIEVDRYKKANLHISVDASGSMGGRRWDQTLFTVASIAKAVSMIPNLELQISFRSTSGTGGGELPWVLMAYDSRKDKLIKIKTLFCKLEPGGTTPEGLAFEAILKELVPATNEVDSYFVNISDGEPYFQNLSISYAGGPAYEHTRKQVDKIKAAGISVLSYFVNEYVYVNQNFVKMYGNSAKFIDIKNIGQISKTMNELFMAKTK